MERRLKEIIPALVLTIALGIGAVACSNSSDDKNGFDPNTDTEFVGSSANGK